MECCFSSRGGLNPAKHHFPAVQAYSGNQTKPQKMLLGEQPRCFVFFTGMGRVVVEQLQPLTHPTAWSRPAPRKGVCLGGGITKKVWGRAIHDLLAPSGRSLPTSLVHSDVHTQHLLAASAQMFARAFWTLMTILWHWGVNATDMDPATAFSHPNCVAILVVCHGELAQLPLVYLCKRLCAFI